VNRSFACTHQRLARGALVASAQPTLPLRNSNLNSTSTKIIFKNIRLGRENAEQHIAEETSLEMI